MNLLMEFCPDDATILLAANVLAQIAVVAALASLLSLGFARRCAAVRHGIWVSAFVCVLISPAVSYIAAQADFSLVSLRLLPRPASADLDVRQPPIPEVAGAEQSSVAADWQTTETGEGSRPNVRPVQYGVSTPYPTATGGADFALTPRPGDQRRALLGMVTLLWAAGVLFLFVRLFHGWRSIVGLQQRLQPVTGDRLRAILPVVRRILNVKALPRLAVLPPGAECTGPITIGILRPRVILPENLIETLDSQGLRDVLLHEFAHALRHDPFVGFLQRLLATAFWPYPPVHLVNRRLSRAREEVCDNYVLRQGDAPSYAETLLTISETFRSVRVQSAALGICHPRGRLEQRVAGLLDPRRNVMTRVHRTTLAALTALLLTTVFVMAGTRFVRAEPPAAPAASADSTPIVQRRAVNQLVKDFPEKTDLSTPESALAAICRADGRADIHALGHLVLFNLGEDDAKAIEQALKHDPSAPKNRNKMMLQIRVVEVLTYGDDLAFAIFKAKSPDGEQRYHGMPLAKTNGKWKGFLTPDLNSAGFQNVQAARKFFDNNKDDLWASRTGLRDWLMHQRGQERHRPADDEQVTAEDKAESSKSGLRPWKLPNGTTMVEASSGPPIADEFKNLIAEKKYEFVRTFDSPNGEKQYVYSFALSDGRRTGMNFSMPLEEVSSWDDYQQKRDQQRQRRHDRINQAVAAGRYRLLDLEVMQVHLCRDVLSDKKFKVQRIRRRDGSEIAFPRSDYGELPPSLTETSWQEHQQAIRDGRRTLLELETVNSYTYEMTVDDGTKVVFQYGGHDPLKMPEE